MSQGKKLTTFEQLESELLKREETILALQQQLDASQHFIDHISIPIALISFNGRIQRANASWASVFDLPLESCPGLSLYDLLPGDTQKIQKYIQQAVESRTSQNFHAQQTFSRGKVWYSNEFHPVFSEGGDISALLVQLVEINQWKVAEEKLIHTVQELDATKKAMVKTQVAKSNFLANITQEIRTPLNSIIGFSQVLLRNIAEGKTTLPENCQYLINNIEQSGHHLSEIINSILDLSQIEAGEMTVTESDIDLRRTLKNIFYLNKIGALQKNLDFSYKIEPHIPQFARSDRSRLEQVLNILLQNAINVTPEKKKVCLGLTLEDDHLVFTVSDEGIGLQSENQSLLADPFDHLPENNDKNRDGNGLELLITKKMVEIMFGTISYESRNDKGNTFTVKIPYIKSDTIEDRHPEAHEKISFSRDNIVLVVEDNLITQELITTIFSHFNLDIHLAGDGKEGVEMACNLKPDLILMDVFMPVMNGVEATSLIRQNPELKDTPIIALSSGAQQNHKTKARDAGVSGYLVKPVTINTIIPILTRYLRTEKTIVYDIDKAEKAKNQQELLTAKLQRDRALQEKQVESRTRELIRARDLAESASQSKTLFLANMSHDIRNPLNAIIGFSQILKKKATNHSLPDKFSEFLDNIIQSGHNLSELVNNVLDITKIEAGKIEITKEVIKLRHLVETICRFNSVQAESKGIKFGYELELDPEISIYSDKNCLNQILMNLIGNAIKFTPKGKTITIKVSRTKSILIFQVIDQGIGIPKEFHEIIFNRYEQLNDNNNYLLRGTGLGLAIVKNRVELLGGTIELESEVGKQSVFTVKIPLEEVQKIPEDIESIADISDKFSRDHRILVIEDDPTNLLMIVALLEDMNLAVEVAENGQQGLEKVCEIQPHLVMMDMNMPVMNGLDAIQSIRKQPEPLNKTPIIVFSGDAFKEQQQEALKAGADAYLTKPIDENKLIPLLIKYLAC